MAAASSSYNARLDNVVCVIDGAPATIYCCICEKYYCDIDNVNFHNSNPDMAGHMRLRLRNAPPPRSPSPPPIPATDSVSLNSSTESGPKEEITEVQNAEAKNIGEGITQGAKSFGKGVADGITGIVMEPIKGGKEEGAVGVLKGVGKGIGGAAVKPVRGTGELLSRAAEGIRNTPTAIFEKDNEEKEHVEVRHVGVGLMVGTRNFGKGIIDGISGVVLEPVKGAQKDGVEGFFKGVGKGLVGVVCKPVAGAIDLVAKPIQGIANTPGAISDKIEENKKKKKEKEIENVPANGKGSTDSFK